jgi:hypothetical protein
LVSKTKKTTFQIHHIAPSANVHFRLTLPRTQFIYMCPSYISSLTIKTLQ